MTASFLCFITLLINDVSKNANNCDKLIVKMRLEHLNMHLRAVIISEKDKAKIKNKFVGLFYVLVTQYCVRGRKNCKKGAI